MYVCAASVVTPKTDHVEKEKWLRARTCTLSPQKHWHSIGNEHFLLCARNVCCGFRCLSAAAALTWFFGIIFLLLSPHNTHTHTFLRRAYVVCPREHYYYDSVKISQISPHAYGFVHCFPSIRESILSDFCLFFRLLVLTFDIFFHFLRAQATWVQTVRTGTKMIMDLPMDDARIQIDDRVIELPKNAKCRVGTADLSPNARQINLIDFLFGTFSSFEEHLMWFVHEVQMDLMPFGCVCYAIVATSTAHKSKSILLVFLNTLERTPLILRNGFSSMCDRHVSDIAETRRRWRRHKMGRFDWRLT